MGMANASGEFTAAEKAQWNDMVAKVLKGAPLSSLDRLDENGIVTHPFYAVDLPDGVSLAKGTDPDSARPQPAILPAQPLTRLSQGWDVCEAGSGTASNADIMDAITSGATALRLNGDDVIQRLDGVVLSAVKLILDEQSDPLATYHQLLQCAAADGASPVSMTPDSLAVDLGLSPETDLSAEIVSLCQTAPASHRLFRIDGWSRHNRGLTTAQEIGFVLAGAACLFRAAATHDLGIMDVAPRISVRLALNADLFESITACRAMRRAWDGLLAACDVDPVQLDLHGTASLRMMSLLDAEVNMLRTTTALLGGAIGGADVMTAAGHDVLTGESAAARRLVRMTQLMMMAESNLATTLDPASGSPFIESRTEALATAGWQAFQAIEAAGGLMAAMETGMIDRWQDAAADAREDRLRQGQDDLLGVTLQPKPEPVPAPLPAFDHVRRPAALIENLRRRAAASPPRILILLGDEDGAANQDRKLRQQLALAGLQAVTLPASGEADIAAATPDIVFGCGLASPPESSASFTLLDAAAFLALPDRVAALTSLIPAEGDPS